MPDREKVIKGLEYCVSSNDCRPCEYWMEFDNAGCQIMKDALELLKDQQNVISGLKVINDGLCEAVTEQKQIVRCNDCKHGQNEEWDNGECVDKTVYCDGYGIHKPDWFCADGKRKEG